MRLSGPYCEEYDGFYGYLYWRTHAVWLLQCVNVIVFGLMTAAITLVALNRRGVAWLAIPAVLMLLLRTSLEIYVTAYLMAELGLFAVNPTDIPVLDEFLRWLGHPESWVTILVLTFVTATALVWRPKPD